MGKRIVRYEHDGIHWGLLTEEGIFPAGQFETLAAFLEHGAKQAEPAGNPVNPEHVTLLSPVTTPAQIVCQGANYSSHREEGGLDARRPPFNLIFTKAASSIAAPDTDIESPAHVTLLDYEIELGLVFGKKLDKKLPEDFSALGDYIAGFVITNDISSRDIQFAENQWYKGKSFRTFCPTGPVLYLFDKDEAEKVHDLELTLKVNGETRQQANSFQLLYKPEETLVELSGMMDFWPGDLLMTGTPGGVALKLSPDEMNELLNPFEKMDKKMATLNKSQETNEHYLNDGDVITSEIKSSDGTIDLGKQTNRVTFLS
ncbi:fumarylacetoacetate hydrolase family protein [Alkalicoccus luteus]|uniref:Fumarylacetoacetate hydrolase family protein n=1 Tax=Alkalicoccus luteus TaxID=1237094 RepID=A0A969PX79_9BACI|nr:fumarylacetoacetate hydrolase family protein [Alkalicoccus luteus]NJP39124.1 fumarylacetoacetate hydrolase family protein [Alkalicoccus luteus]